MENRNEEKLLTREIIKEYKIKYPFLEKLTISYEGSGDNFGDFYDYDFHGCVPTLFDEIKIYNEIFSSLEDGIWGLISYLGADFNNEGSRGDITINFEEGIMSGDNYYYERTEMLNNETKNYFEDIQEID